MSTPFRLSAGDLGPTQQSPVTCGSACLTVARMLVDPLFASWIRTGSPVIPGAPAALASAPTAARFAAYERVVMDRTNRLSLAPGRPNPPWPHALGTPPWGALHELEHGAAVRGTRYAIVPVRQDGAGGLRSRYDRLVDVVADGEPALLYIGNQWLPRHVTLVLPGGGDRVVDVYEPASGRVEVLRRDDMVGRRLRLAGWDVPWVVVQPTGLRREPVQAPLPAGNPAPA